MDNVELGPGQIEHVAMHAENQVARKHDSAPPEQEQDETENPASQQDLGDGFEQIVRLCCFRHVFTSSISVFGL